MFNPPPADLSDREPLFHVASTTDFWDRSHRVGNSPIYFGKSQTHRWDSPDGDFGVLYLGRTVIRRGDIARVRILCYQTGKTVGRDRLANSVNMNRRAQYIGDQALGRGSVRA